jgi:alkylated DNA repair dioxygenase AlkB
LDSYFDSGNQSNSTSKKRAASASSSSFNDPKRYIATVRNILSSKSPSAFGTCPICNNTNIPIHRLAIHASQCNGKEQKQQQQKNDPDISNANKKRSPATLLQQPFKTDSQHQSDGMAVAEGETPLTNCFSSLVNPTEGQEDSPALNTIMSNLLYSEPIPGLYVFENFLTEYEETQILSQLGNNNKIDTRRVSLSNSDNSTGSPTNNSWKVATFNGKHYGQRWGVHCNLRTRQVLPEERSLPKFYYDYILPKLQNLGDTISSSKISTIIKGYVPNEMNAIDYYKSLGHSLSAHVDDRHLSKEVILNLSLAGDCYMTFTPVEKPRASSSSLPSQPNVAVRVLLKRRCLQILTGPARYQYTHGIHHNDLLHERRVSLTMRESPITNKNGTKPATAKVTSISTTKAREMTQGIATQNRKSPVTSNIIVATKPSSITSLSWVKSDVIESFRSPSPTVLIGKPIFNQVSLDVPPGLYIFPNFITKQQEEELIKQLDQSTNIPHWSIERHTGIHREKRWGVDHDLWSRQVREPIHAIPNWIESIIIQRLQLLRLQSENNDSSKKENEVKFSALMRLFGPNDVNAIEYKRDNGHSLGAHIDDRQKHTEPIANLSLVGNCYMEYTVDLIKKNTKRNAPMKGVKLAKANCTDDSETALKDLYRVYLPRRTLQILTGRARYEYRHGIHNSDLSSERRISITLRETRP